MSRKLLVALALTAIATLLSVGLLRQPASTTAALGQRPSEINLAPNSLPGIELISAVLTRDANAGLAGDDVVELTFRNATGADILSIDFARGAEETTQGFGRDFGDVLEPKPWAAGAVTSIMEMRQGNAPVRVTAIEFADGRAAGDGMRVAFYRQKRNDAAAHLEAALADVRARAARAGSNRRKQKEEAAALVAELTGRVSDEVVRPGVTLRNGNPLDDLVARALRKATAEAGEDKALVILEAALDRAVTRNRALAVGKGVQR